MAGSCGVFGVVLSAGALSLYGILFDALGAIAFSGYGLTFVNRLGRRAWPPYRRIETAWDTLHADGKISRGDEGFCELVQTIAGKDHLIEDDSLHVTKDELEYAYIKFSDDAARPFTNDDDIEVEIQFADNVESRFSLSDTSHMTRKLAIDLINQRIKNGFLKAGVIFLASGVLLQLYVEYTRMTDFYLLSC